jgi:hypothetical protein
MDSIYCLNVDGTGTGGGLACGWVNDWIMTGEVKPRRDSISVFQKCESGRVPMNIGKRGMLPYENVPIANGKSFSDGTAFTCWLG